MSFDGYKYTEQSVLEELSLMERHARDGSAVKGGCACIEEKHLLTLAGLSSEMPTLTKNREEAEYYAGLADLARDLRLEIISGDFKRSPSHNPGSVKLTSCIKQVTLKCCGAPTKDYSKCTCNPVAVCRAAIKKLS